MKTSIMMAAVLMMVASGCTCGKIEPGHVGVVVPLSGNDKGHLETTSNGWYLYSFNTQVYEFPTYNQPHNWSNEKGQDERLHFGDKNGLQLGADIGIQFHVPAANVTKLFQTYRQELDRIRDTILKNTVRNALNMTAQNYTAEEIFGDQRGIFMDKVKAKVIKDVEENGIVVTDIYMNGLDLPKQISETIQAKLQATMLAQKAENEKRTVTAEAEKDVAKAEGVARAQVATAEGQAKTDVAKATGEATAKIAAAEGAAKARIAAAKGNADALVLEATAQALANQKIAQSLTPQILELKKLEISANVQKAYAEKWQGGVPTTILPGQVGGQFLDIRGMGNPNPTK